MGADLKFLRLIARIFRRQWFQAAGRALTVQRGPAALIRESP
jgi:hypothetical protein